ERDPRLRALPQVDVERGSFVAEPEDVGGSGQIHILRRFVEPRRAAGAVVPDPPAPIAGALDLPREESAEPAVVLRAGHGMNLLLLDPLDDLAERELSARLLDHVVGEVEMDRRDPPRRPGPLVGA